MGKERWEYVQLNSTFTEDGINHGAVHTVSRFLQHTLCIVDAIYAELVLPRYRAVETIAENKTEDGSKDNEGSRNGRDGDDHPPPTGSDNRVHPSPPAGGGCGSSLKRPSTRSQAARISSFMLTEQDNQHCYLPLTKSNLEAVMRTRDANAWQSFAS